MQVSGGVSLTKIHSTDFSPIGEIEVRWRSDGAYSTSRASDLSSTGAFIATANPLPPGTSIGLRFETAAGDISIGAVVRRVNPGEGMGVEFQSISPGDRARLDVVVQRAGRPITAQAPAQTTGSGEQPAEHPTSSRLRLQRSPERRARSRYKFSATAELIECDTGRSIAGQLRDLGASGCYVKTDAPFPPGASAEISVTYNGQSFRTRANVKSSQSGKGMGLAFAEIDPQDRQVLEEWLATASERAWLATNRRLSQRVMVSIPVHVEAKDRFGLEQAENTQTISVSAGGALLALEMDVIKGQTITLRDPVTQQALECSVAYLGSSTQGRRQVGVSFVQTNRRLWQIAFPPSDWSPQDPYAKGS
jgi:hypothetical protein